MSKTAMILAADPTLTRRQVAQLAGCTREYVRQTMKQYGLVFQAVRGNRQRLCAECGEPVKGVALRHRGCYVASLKVWFTCESCGEPFSRRKTFIADRRRRPGYKKDYTPRWCRGRCPENAPCARCGEEVRLSASQRFNLRHGTRVLHSSCRGRLVRRTVGHDR